MKKYMLLILIPVFFACGRAAKERAQELQVRNDSLMIQTAQKDVAINEFVKSVDDIQSILDSIKIKENLINVKTLQIGERKVTARQQIKDDINQLYSEMLKDKEAVNKLSKKLRSSGAKLKEFQTLIDRLQKEVEEKNTEIAALQGNLEKMNIAFATAKQKIDTLDNLVQDKSQEITRQSQVIDEQTTALNTAYYIVGTRKELRDDGIIKGGKIVPDFNRSRFTKVDITKTNEIPLKKVKVKMLSNHPSSSFRLNKEGDVIKSIQVTDIAAFWSNTKYLVLETSRPQ